MSQYPRTFSHIGLSVPDVDAAVKFYSEVLGFYTIMPPTAVTEDNSDIGEMCSDVFGPEWKKLRIAHMSTADRVGIGGEWNSSTSWAVSSSAVGRRADTLYAAATLTVLHTPAFMSSCGVASRKISMATEGWARLPRPVSVAHRKEEMPSPTACRIAWTRLLAVCWDNSPRPPSS